MYFLGKHDYSMDERGRVPMPPRYREALMKGMVLTEGTPDPCLRVYTTEEFARKAEQYLSQPVTTQSGRDARNVFFGSAEPATMDKQSRILIPPNLREYAGLKGPVVVFGNGDSFLIWDAQTFETYAPSSQERQAQRVGTG